jgi:hypothetical protein
MSSGCAQMTRVPPESGHDLVPDDAPWRVPERPEDHVLDRIGKQRCARAGGAADDDTQLHRGTLGGRPLERDETERGDVRDQELPSRGVGEPAQALEGQLDLAHAARQRHVQRAHGGGAEHTVDAQPMSPLEMFDGLDQRSPVEVALRRRRGEVAQRQKQAGQSGQVAVRVAGVHGLHRLHG